MEKLLIHYNISVMSMIINYGFPIISKLIEIEDKISITLVIN